MADVLVRFTEAIHDDNRERYRAQASGAVDASGHWEGWIEFVREDGTAFRTPRETEQPNRNALMYWAEGLTTTYLEGALTRALDALAERSIRVSTTERSRFERPAANPRPEASPRRSHAVLDPFATYEQGEEVLRQELDALSRDHLATIVDAYALPVDVSPSVTDRALVDAIVRAVATRHSALHS